METNNLIISPKTKILQLIEAYPQLEDVLISYVPAFEKLKNPVLRNTVARIATLQQAANIGNAKVEDLINVLRKEIGQDEVQIAEDSGYNIVKPDWFDENNIKQEFDVREMLAAGEHPVNQVISDIHKLPENTIYKLIAPFLPAPLIDKASSLNTSHWIQKENEQLYNIYFIKKEA